MHARHLVALILLLLAAACGGGSSATQPAAASPTADAGPDQAVASGAAVTLDGSGSSDPGSHPLTYAWSQASGPAVTLSSASARQPTFDAPGVPPGGAAAALVFSLTVTSTGGASAPATVTVTVAPQVAGTTPPVANAGPDQSVASGAAVALDGRGSSASAGGALTSAWTQTSGTPVTLSGAATAQPTFTAPAVAAGSPAETLVFSLTVTEGATASTPDTVAVTVNPSGSVTNPPPPGTPAPAAPNPSPLPPGPSGHRRFQIGAAQGLYLVDPAAGEPTILGFVNVGVVSPAGTLPTDIVVTINGTPIYRDPLLNGNFFRVRATDPQPVVGSGGQMVVQATGTLDGKLVGRQIVFNCPSDIAVTSAPAVGAPLVPAAAPATPLRLTSPSTVTLNIPGIPLLASIFPVASLWGYDPATRAIVGQVSTQNVAAGPLDVGLQVHDTTAGAYLADLRWMGIFELDGETGGFCGLVKRFAYAK